MNPIIHQMNKNGSIVYTLYRDSTDFIEGHHVKNLNWINRDLSKVIVVDWNPESVKLHPSNAFIIKRWDGSDDDQTLIDLASFLRGKYHPNEFFFTFEHDLKNLFFAAIAFNKVEDVREVLQYYRQFEDPIEAFRENQRKLMVIMANFTIYYNTSYYLQFFFLNHRNN